MLPLTLLLCLPVIARCLVVTASDVEHSRRQNMPVLNFPSGRYQATTYDRSNDVRYSFDHCTKVLF